MILKKRIKKNFPSLPSDTLVLSNPTSSAESEAVEQTMGFIGKRWKDVLPGEWVTSPRAVFFFTDLAFAYYLPSLMICSLSEYILVRPSLENLWFKLRDLSDTPRSHRSRSRFNLTADQLGRIRRRQRLQWSQFNDEQVRTILEWIVTVSDFEASVEMKRKILQSGETLKEYSDNKMQ